MASGVAAPYLARMCFSRLPPLTPMRMGMCPAWQARTTSLTRSSLPMLPGLIRILSTPTAAQASAAR